MLPMEPFDTRLPHDLKSRLHSLNSPPAIQEYLDCLKYVAEDLDRSPLRVMRDGQCHCLDGGIFAALALARLGLPALILGPRPRARQG